MKPYLSIVIPYRNAPFEIERLVGSLARSKNAPPYEIIIVDDGSNLNNRLTIHDSRFKNSVKGKKNVKIFLHIITLPHNVGPAIARNRGVTKARGKFVVFMDCDVEAFPDTLHNLAKVFSDDPDVVALTGVWVKDQKSDSFFPNFKALRDWSYWINERDKSGYYFLFSTRIAAIKRSVFLRLGGFDETYPAPLVEDIELTYRIARRYAIIFAPHVRVRHQFEEFWPIAKKYFLRAYYWTKLYARRKKFDPVATTWWEALTSISGVMTVLFGITSLVSLPTLPLVFSLPHGVPTWVMISGLIYYVLFFVWLTLHFLMVRKFLFFVYKEKGFIFSVKSFFMGLVLYCFIFAGAAWGRLH
jgi:glycosyltransferase involved in cell wall biosynthesis